MNDLDDTTPRTADTPTVDESFGWAEVRTAPADAALAGLVESRSAAGLSDAELVDALAARQRLANAAEGHVLALMGELDRRRAAGPARDCRDARDLTSRAQVVTEVVAATRQPKGRVQALLQVSDTLRTSAPTTWGWLQAGRIGGYQARIVADALDSLLDPSLLPVVEARILGEITADNETGGSLDDEVGLVAATSTQVRAIAVRAVAEAEPDQHQARHRRAFADRRLMLRGDLDADGMGALTLHYDTLTVQAIYHRLGLVARNTTSADDPRTLTQRVADLAAGLLTGHLAPVTTPTSDLEQGAAPPIRRTGAGVGAQVHITMTAATLAGASDAPGRLPGGGVVPAALARRIAHQPSSTWYRLLTDPLGRLLDLTSTGYRPSAPLSRAVSVLHPTCTAPGCTRPALGCELDHEVPWPAGPTDLGNLSPKCKGHHTAKTAGRVSTSKAPDGSITWRYPTGHSYTTRPPRHPVDHWPQHWVEPDSQQQVQQALAALQRETDRHTRDDITDLKRHALDQRLAHWEAQAPPDRWPDRDSEQHESEPSYEEYTAARSTLQAMLS